MVEELFLNWLFILRRGFTRIVQHSVAWISLILPYKICLWPLPFSISLLHSCRIPEIFNWRRDIKERILVA